MDGVKITSQLDLPDVDATWQLFAIADLNGATKAREMVVKKAQEYLDSLSQEAGEDRELLWELSTAYLKLGDVQGRPGFSRTGDTGTALQSYEKSLDIPHCLAQD